MEARASAKYLRGSAQKARLVIDMIRGKNVNQALAILRYSNKRAALGIEKCVKSAIANANETAEKANVSVDPDELWLKAAYVDRGPTKHRRRVRPAPQGRAYREQRHFCHVTILLSSETQEAEGKADGKTGGTTPAASKRAKRGGAAAAPRAKRVGKAEATTKAGDETKKAAGAKESKGATNIGKAASKLGKALRRKKSEE
ncbi:MAG: 50S ribosomal protein L22 [Acidobacteria bacterium]|nr:MAG: 50S ribosomal protein L22 [Acidobacteriota bacterium]PYS62853.1 MAG: 50S ribosomal protein L22 [Acidobacteriota bacterium]